MAVPQQIPRNVSTATAGATVFAYNFKILRAADLQVIVNGVQRTLDVDYTVSGVNSDTGGNVEFVAPMVGGETVVRRRNMAIKRDTDYQNLGDLRSPTLNNDQDEPVMMIQQIAETLDRTLTLPTSTTASGLLPNAEPLRALVWSADGQRLENGDTSLTGDMLLRPALDEETGSALVGYKARGMTAARRTVMSKLQEMPSILDYIPEAEHAAIFARTSTYDCTAAIQAAVNANPNCSAPAGRYLISNVIVMPANHCLLGEGPRATTFARAGSAMSFFSLGSNCSLSGMGFTQQGSATITSGRLIDIAVSDCTLSGIYATDCWDGIYITSCAGMFMDWIQIRNFRNNGIHVNGTTNDVFLDQFLLVSNGSMGTGIRLENKCEAFTASNGDIILTTTAMATGAAINGTGVRPAYCKFTNVYFDSSPEGVILDKCADFRFSNCWFSHPISPGIRVRAALETSFVNCDFVNCGGSGAQLETGAVHTKFIGCSFLNNNTAASGANGLTVQANVSDFTVIGCTANNLAGTGGNQGVGIFIAPGTSDNFVLIGNNVVGNSSSGIADNSTGTNKRITGNIGYTQPAIAAGLVNSWANSGPPQHVAGYWKDSDGVVHLEGRISGGTAPSVAMVLPPGYRPSATEDFAVIAAGALGWVFISSTGEVTVQSGAALVGLGGITFRAA